MTTQIICGNNIELLKQYPDNYFDSIVTDAPYGLGKEPNAVDLMKDWVEKGYHEISGTGFMGKDWDSFVPQPLLWKEAFRVLKHGGHVLSFFGTRTYDWGVMAMRFAGFEVRDTITWHYGSGFPKSHNISKALDKMGGESLDWFIEYILEVAKERGITKKELTMLFPSKNGNPTGWLWNKQNNQSITLEQYNTIKDYLNLPFDNIEEAKREVIGKGKAGLTKGDIANFSGETEFDITAPSTDAAKQWDGWGSALKPASEPIVLARKPLEKGLSIAENVIKWGVGGINIDGCRISTNGEKINIGFSGKILDDTNGWNSNNIERTPYDSTQGRFPANVIFSHHEDCVCNGTKKVKAIKGGVGGSESMNKQGYGFNKIENAANSGGLGDADGNEEVEDWDCVEDCPIRILDEQSGILKTGARTKDYSLKNKSNSLGVFKVNTGKSKASEGTASRFFYTAKSSKGERNKGLDDFEEKSGADITGRKEGSKGLIMDGRVNNPYAGASATFAKTNFHPTVKPIKLMQYLVRLITPPNGIVLDPFNGSGTTGIAAKLEGFNYVGLELDPEYCKISEARISAWEIDKPENDNQLSLF